MLLTKNCHFQQRWNGTFLKAQCRSSVRKTKTEVRLVRTPDISNPDIESPRERIRTYGTRTVIVLEGSGCIVAIVARLARITFSYCLAFNQSELGFRFGSKTMPTIRTHHIGLLRRYHDRWAHRYLCPDNVVDVGMNIDRNNAERL